jgi:hypothetical protein
MAGRVPAMTVGRPNIEPASRDEGIHIKSGA